MPFQFASAAFLALGLATPLLVLAYTRKQTRDARKVSSILLLRKLPKHSVVRKKVKLPPNFWFELLALLMLVAAASYPLYQGSGKRTAIILDNSLSMSAQGRTKPTIFAEAIRKLLNWMDEQPSGNSYTLYTSSPSLQRIGESSISSGRVEEYVADLAPTLTSDSISSSIEQLGESGSYDQLIVVSDRQIRELESARGDDIELDHSTKVKGLTVGGRASNLFISSIGVETSGVRTQKRKVVTRIAQSGGEKREIEVELQGAAGGSTDYSTLQKTLVELNGDSSRELQIPVPESANSMRSFLVRINADSDDALDLDNEAWASVDAAPESAVLLVSPIQPGPDAFGLKNIGGIRVVHVTPEEYARLAPSKIKRFAIALFHRTAPIAAPPIATLLVLPPKNNLLFPVRMDINDPVLSSWDSTHPLTTYLRVPLLNPSAVAVFDVPLWARSIVNIEQGSILASGESRGVRFAALGMEILPFEGASTPAASVLTINLIRWLSGSSELSFGYRTGTRYELQGDTTWVIADPGGAIETIETSQEKPDGYSLSRPGLYTVTRISGGSSDTLKRSTEILPVNVFYPQESATSPPPPISSPKTIEHQEVSEQAATPMWPEAIMLALLLLLAEFGIRTYQATRSTAEVSA